MHLKIVVALCPPTSQRTAQPWPESPLSIIAPIHSVHSILRVRLIIGDDRGDSDSDGDEVTMMMIASRIVKVLMTCEKFSP